MRTVSGVGRIAAVAAVVAAAVLVGFLIFGGGGGYTVKAYFINGNQLVKGNQVELDGTPIGSVKDLGITPNGQAVVTLKINSEYAPLHDGVKATIRQASQSGIANRFVDLQVPGANRAGPAIPDGGEISADNTTTSVDLDQLFNTLDPPTRKALQGFFKGQAKALAGKGAMENVAFQYLNPALSTSRRLFNELNRDTPTLEHFVSDSSRLVTALASRRDDLSALIQNLNNTMGAIGSQKVALADALQRLPGFMRRSNTTFVNLRAALTDLKPLVDDSKPAVKALRPFLAELRPFAQDARPTVRDLAGIVRRTGKNNDLVELTRSSVPLRDIAVGPVQANGKQREGALPATVKALGEATPELAFARPYAVDLTGWFDDFTHSGVYDALGGASRAALYVNGFSNINGILKPLLPGDRESFFNAAASLNNRNRCPGSIERGGAWKPTPDYNCDLSQVPLGP
jgi:phospholipid/cholesterol/gamma-HCH transport system substrate-binding protein